MKLYTWTFYGHKFFLLTEEPLCFNAFARYILTEIIQYIEPDCKLKTSFFNEMYSNYKLLFV